jgi:hypothetical protein
MAALCLATAAQAAIVSGSASGSFGDLSGGPNVRIVDANGVAGSQLQWGSTANRNGSFVDPSTLTAVGIAFCPEMSGDDVVIGRIDWYNSTTRVNRMPGALEVDWTLALRFADPVGTPALRQTFELEIRNTTHAGSDANMPDTIKGLELDDLGDLARRLGNVTLSDLRYSLGGGGAGSTLRRDGDEWIWSNAEGNTASLLITADITLRAPPVVAPPAAQPPAPPAGPTQPTQPTQPTAVPEPGTAGLLALGLLGMGMLGRRRLQAR